MCRLRIRQAAAAQMAPRHTGLLLLLAACAALLALPAACGVANPLLQQRLLGSQGAHKRVYHVEGDKGMVMADPAPRQRLGGRCGAAACDDIPFPTPWSKVRGSHEQQHCTARAACQAPDHMQGQDACRTWTQSTPGQNTRGLRCSAMTGST